MNYAKMAQDFTSESQENNPAEVQSQEQSTESVETQATEVEQKQENVEANEQKATEETQENSKESSVESSESQDESSLHTTESQDSSDKESKQEVTEDDILQYLRGQRGLEIESLDDISKKETFDEDSVFANDYVKTLNKFIRDTGRTEEEFKFIQAMENVDSFSSKDLVLAKMAQDNEGLSDEEVQLLFDDEYSYRKIDEEIMDDDEIAAAKRHNDIVDAKLKRNSIQAKKDFTELATQYKVPQKQDQTQEQTSTEDDFDKEGFKSAFKESLQALEGFDFELGNDNTFSYTFNEDRLNEIEAITPDDFIQSFVSDEGFDMEEFRNKMVLLNNIEDIVRQASSQSASSAKEQVVKEDLRNTQLNLQNKDTSSGNDTVKNQGEDYDAGMKAIFGRR